MGGEAFGHLNINYAAIAAPLTSQSSITGRGDVLFLGWFWDFLQRSSVHSSGTGHPGNLPRGLESKEASEGMVFVRGVQSN